MKPHCLWVLGCLAILWGSLAAGPGASTSPDSVPSPQELGQDLFQRLACHGCHAPSSPGGKQGPDLGEVGQRLTEVELVTQLLTPRQRRADSRMPSFAFVRPHELEALQRYVKSLP